MKRRYVYDSRKDDRIENWLTGIMIVTSILLISALVFLIVMFPRH